MGSRAGYLQNLPRVTAHTSAPTNRSEKKTNSANPGTNRTPCSALFTSTRSNLAVHSSGSDEDDPREQSESAATAVTPLRLQSAQTLSYADSLVMSSPTCSCAK